MEGIKLIIHSKIVTLQKYKLQHAKIINTEFRTNRQSRY